MKNRKISAGQWVTLLVVSRLSGAVMFAPITADGFDVWSAVLYGATWLLLLLPGFLAARAENRGRTAELHPAVSKGTAALLCLYTLYVLAATVLQFMTFAQECLSSDVPAAALGVALMVAAFAAAGYGLEALARAALPIAVLLIGSMAVVSVWLIPEEKTGYLIRSVLQPAGVNGWLSETARSSETAIAGLLLAHVEKPRFRSTVLPAALWITGGVLAVRVTVVATLGSFAATRLYPYHTAVTAIETGVFRRMDLIAVSIWIAAVFVKTALFAWSFLRCARIVAPRRSRWLVPIGALMATAAGVWLGVRPRIGADGWLLGMALGGMALLAVAAPLWRWTTRKKGAET